MFLEAALQVRRQPDIALFYGLLALNQVDVMHRCFQKGNILCFAVEFFNASVLAGADSIVIGDGICQDISIKGVACMSHSVVGKWGKNLAIRVPMDVARASGLADGEMVEVEMQDGDLVVRRRAAHLLARREAEAAAAEIIAESRRHSLGEISIRELIEEGRRG